MIRFNGPRRPRRDNFESFGAARRSPCGRAGHRREPVSSPPNGLSRHGRRELTRCTRWRPVVHGVDTGPRVNAAARCRTVHRVAGQVALATDSSRYEERPSRHRRTWSTNYQLITSPLSTHVAAITGTPPGTARTEVTGSCSVICGTFQRCRGSNASMSSRTT